MITQINEFKLITESNNEYPRIIPRDFFNESKLLKCMGRLALLKHKGNLPDNININVEESGEPFHVKLHNEYGCLYVSNYNVTINDIDVFVGTLYNSKNNYPLVCYYDYTEYLVFDENGNFDDEFIEFFSSLSDDYIQESVTKKKETKTNFDKIIDMKNLLNLSKGINIISIDYGDIYINKEEYKIAINLGDSNPFSDDGLTDIIKNVVFDNYSECEKLINIEIDCEWIPGRGEDGWLVYDIYKNDFIKAK